MIIYYRVSERNDWPVCTTLASYTVAFCFQKVDEVGEEISSCRRKNDLEIACCVQRDMALLPFLLFCRYKTVACIGTSQENTLKLAGWT